jgi:hypothetical protein
MKFNLVTKPYPLDIALWPKQQEARDKALIDMRDQNFSILKIGMRGGKSWIAAEVARLMEKKLVYIFDTDDYGLSKDFPISSYFCASTIPPHIEQNKIDTRTSMVVINNAFWLKDSASIFNRIRGLVPELPILVIGSNGPEFLDRWYKKGGHGYATWEINPHVTEHYLRDQMIHNPADAVAFDRDFAKF